MATPWGTSMQSPAAHTPAHDVAIRSSTMMRTAARSALPRPRFTASIETSSPDPLLTMMSPEMLATLTRPSRPTRIFREKRSVCSEPWLRHW